MGVNVWYYQYLMRIYKFLFTGLYLKNKKKCIDWLEYKVCSVEKMGGKFSRLKNFVESQHRKLAGESSSESEGITLQSW